MAAYATVEDLHDLWPDMPPGSDAHATKLLNMAAVVIRAEAGDIDDRDADLLKLISCEMVMNAMKSPDHSSDISSLNMTAGPYTQQVSFRDNADDLYLTRKHRKWLGIGRQRAFSIDLLGSA